MTLSAAAYIEKNKLHSPNVWLVLLKLTLPNLTVLRLVANTEQVIWPVIPGTSIYIAFPFELDEISDGSAGEVPQFTIRVSNTTRIMESYMDDQDGMVDTEVKIYVVNSVNVATPSLGAGDDNQNPDVELDFMVVGSSANNMWASFTLGASNPFRKRFPRNKVQRDLCKHIFKGTRCQYTGGQTICDRTLYTCRNTMVNSVHFGGAPGVSSKGIYV